MSRMSVRIGLVAVFVVALLASVVPYYAGRSAALLSIFPLFAVIAIRKPGLAVFLLFASMPFFGNHPGGRFMEIFPILCIIWLFISAVYHSETIDRRFLFAYVGYASLLILPIILNPDLFRAAHFYKNGLFHLLNSHEHSPLYSLQQIIWLAAVPPIAFTALKHKHEMIRGIAAGFAITVIVGTLDIFIPSFAALLDRIHIAIDGYVNRSRPHGVVVLPQPMMWFSRSPNSLFWNRSWHSVFLVAALPFLHLFLYEALKSKNRRLRHAVLGSVSLFLTLYFLAIGARGGLVAGISYLCIAGTGFFLLTSSRRLTLLPLLPVISIGAALLLQTILPLLFLLTEVGKLEPRLPQFAAAVRIFIMFPFFGGGTESYGYYNNVFLRAASVAARHGTAHNQLLQILSGNGIAGFLFYTGLLGAFAFNIRRRLIDRHSDPVPSILILAGMTSSLVYGSVQEWNYIRPVIILWSVLLLFVSDRPSHRIPLLPVIIPIILMGLTFSYRPVLSDSTPVFPHMEFPEIHQESEPFIPESPWIGVEFIAPDRFVVMQGNAHLRLPLTLRPEKITPLREKTQIRLAWSPGAPGSEERYLRIRCHSTSPDLRGDFDARRLCAEITIPESAKFFQSLERPALYRERTKQRGLF